MPQLDAAFYPSQLFWLAVSFGLLYYVLWRHVLPRASAILEERRALTAGRRGDAARDAEEAARLEAEVKDMLSKRRASAQAEAREMTERAAAETASLMEAADESLEKRVAEHETSLKANEKEWQARIDASAAEVAADIVEALTGKRPDEAACLASVAQARGAL